MLRLPDANRMHVEQPMPVALETPAAVAPKNWKSGLQAMRVKGVTIRELRVSDAPSLLANLTTEEVARFISPPPVDVEGFERFIAWSHQQRAAGTYMCFGIVPDGRQQAIGLVQVRALEPSFAVAEWGFAIGSAFWGTGIFPTAARAVLDFLFATVGAQRVEARACVENWRGNGALRKLGAVKEGLLRNAFRRGRDSHDQFLWAVTAIDWAFGKAAGNGASVH